MDIDKSTIHLFQSQERLELLDDIDRFREDGLDNLPQIVVCGDTSSGKSSVLAALSGLPFPVSGTLCTRFATEIALRYSASKTVTGHAFITPAKDASETHRKEVQSFWREIVSVDEIPALLDSARKKMGLGEVSGISRDVLHLRFDGPALPNLTLVDLPGLIHASRNTEDIPMVQSLVEHYFRQERSIILIVVSAENPIENQGILTFSQRFDPKGIRSIGVITKPDVLERPDKVSLKPAILELVRNQNTAFKFARGWYLVRCLNDKERNDGLDRDAVERALFDQEPWRSIPHGPHGTKALRLALGRYLHQHILQVLPELQMSLEKRLDVVKSSLEILGDSRTTHKERVRYLVRISKSYSGLVRDALEGNYSDAFFKDHDPAKRLRATTMALTDKYERSMRTVGHSFEISREQSPTPLSSPHSPEKISQSEALLKVGKLLETHRGPELSFLFNPRLVGELFKEQSQKWPVLTSEYVGQVCLAVQTFSGMLLEYICPSTGESSELIFRHILDDAIQNSFKDLESGADELFRPYTKPFLFSIRSRLQTSLKRIQAQDVDQEKASTASEREQPSVPEIMGSDYDTRIRLLQYSRAYYEVALETFVDNVIVLGVESRLLSKLESMFTSETVVQMEESLVDLVGSESADTQEERQELNKQLETLTVSLKRCRRHTSRLYRTQVKIGHDLQAEVNPNSVRRKDESQNAAASNNADAKDAISEAHVNASVLIPNTKTLDLPSTPRGTSQATSSHPSSQQPLPELPQVPLPMMPSALPSSAKGSDKVGLVSHPQLGGSPGTSLFGSTSSDASATGSATALSKSSFGSFGSTTSGFGSPYLHTSTTGSAFGPSTSASSLFGSTTAPTSTPRPLIAPIFDFGSKSPAFDQKLSLSRDEILGSLGSNSKTQTQGMNGK